MDYGVISFGGMGEVMFLMEIFDRRMWTAVRNNQTANVTVTFKIG